MKRTWLLWFGMALVVACSGEDRPKGIANVFPDAGQGGGAGSPLFDASFQDGPPPADASGFCGNQFFEVTQEPPNLYFVIDRSGSMTDKVAPGSGISRYTAVRTACVALVGELGDRVNVGAAVFPGSPLIDECGAGAEVFPTRPGDEPQATDGGGGPVTQAFAAATNVQPKGGTPIARTFQTLLPTLSALEGETAVILATDGGPNCSYAHKCGAADCIWNIEGAYLLGDHCVPDYNCCDTSIANGPGPLGCLDSAATVAAVSALRDAGIRTYVVGIPGSQHYASLLDQLATVGGSARPGSPAYYRVDDINTLGDALAQIGYQALATCDFALDAAPPKADFVNVYLDNELVAYDEANGWSWTSDTTLSLNGDACEALKTGSVSHVQVVAGCPTQQPL